MATYRDLIAGSLRLIGVIGDGEVPSPYQADNALFALNEMFDSWNSDGLMIFTTAFKTLPLTASAQQWTIGPGADIDVPVRPSELDGAWLRQNASAANPIDIPMSVLSPNEWGDIRSKYVSSAIPRFIFLNGDWPVATIFIWPVPQVNDTELILNFGTPLTSTVTLDDIEAHPPAYRQAIRYNLAVLLAAEFGREAPPAVVAQAYKSKNLIAQNNQNIDRLDFDSAIQGTRQGRYWIGDDQTR